MLSNIFGFVMVRWSFELSYVKSSTLNCVKKDVDYRFISAFTFKTFIG